MPERARNFSREPAFGDQGTYGNRQAGCVTVWEASWARDQGGWGVKKKKTRKKKKKTKVLFLPEKGVGASVSE